MTAKLTKAQRELLRDLGDRQSAGVTCSENYVPARRLIAMRLASSAKGRYGQHVVHITEAGRALLAQSEAGE